MVSKFVKIGTVFIILIALIALNNSASASSMPSKNSEMPTHDQFMDWRNSFNSEGNFVDLSYNSYIETFPKGHVDKIKDKDGNIAGIVFYNYNPDKGPEGYDANYYDLNGNKLGIGCNSGLVLTNSYKGEGSSKSEEKEVKEENKPVIKDEDDSDEVEEEDETESGDNRTYTALVEFLAEDGTNENGFSTSKACAAELKENLESEGWETQLVKATFKATGKNGKHLIRYCVEVKTTDEGTVYIDSYGGKTGGIDKRVTVLKPGLKWKAESADGICPADEIGRYNRGKVLKVKIIEE